MSNRAIVISSVASTCSETFAKWRLWLLCVLRLLPKMRMRGHLPFSRIRLWRPRLRRKLLSLGSFERTRGHRRWQQCCLPDYLFLQSAVYIYLLAFDALTLQPRETHLLVLWKRLRRGMKRLMRRSFLCVLVAVFMPPCECSVRIHAYAIVSLRAATPARLAHADEPD